jgi:ribosomal protein S18 acetylase RimI-like enzyme
MSKRMGVAVLRGLERALTSVRPRRLPPVSPPAGFTDEMEREIRVRSFREGDFDALAGMYDDFDRSQRAQGIPPRRRTEVEQWLEGVLTGPDTVALENGQVVGHVSLVPDGSDSHELAIFVHQAHQDAGIGTHLLAAGLDQADEVGVTHVWLTVERQNRRAKRLYRRAGFSTVDPRGTVQRMSRHL